jgi:hypothetical protein
VFKNEKYVKIEGAHNSLSLCCIPDIAVLCMKKKQILSNIEKKKCSKCEKKRCSGKYNIL